MHFHRENERHFSDARATQLLTKVLDLMHQGTTAPQPNGCSNLIDLRFLAHVLRPSQTILAAAFKESKQAIKTNLEEDP